MSSSRLTFPFLALGAVAVGVVAAGASCTATNGSGTFTGGSASTATTTGIGGDIGFDAGIHGDSGAGGDDTTCAEEPYAAKQAPLDMFIMLDQSGSMDKTVTGGQTKWEAVTEGIKSFITQPNNSGISVGIQYFGLSEGGCPSTCLTDFDCGDCGPCFLGTCLGGALSDSCNVDDYAKPDVEIAPLPGNASAIITSIGKHGPNSGTPTAPALQGAIKHASQWAQTVPGHVTIAVFATDGIPSSTCSPSDTASIALIASQGAQAGIKTFAIGVFEDSDKPAGPNLMDAIASNGGTGSAFIFDTTNPNVQGEFTKALDMIRGASLGCQYAIPTPMAGTMPDPKKLNVKYTPGGSTVAQTFDHYPDKASCAGLDGWYYDNNAAPTQVLLCDKTCSTVSADAMGKISIALGCKTKEPG